MLARHAHSTHSKNIWNVSNGSEHKGLWVMGKRVSRWMRLRHQHCTNETGLCLPWEDTEDTQVWLDKHTAWGRDQHPLKHRKKSTQTQQSQGIWLGMFAVKEWDEVTAEDRTRVEPPWIKGWSVLWLGLIKTSEQDRWFWSGNSEEWASEKVQEVKPQRNCWRKQDDQTKHKAHRTARVQYWGQREGPSQMGKANFKLSRERAF